MIRISFWLALVAVAAMPSSLARAQSPNIEIEELGLGGRYKVGHWTPVRLTIIAGDAPLRGNMQLVTPDGDGVQSTYTGGPLAKFEIAAKQSQQLTAYVRFGRTQSGLIARFIDEAGERTTQTLDAADVPPAILTSQQRVVIVGAKIGEAEALRFFPRPSSEQLIVTQITDAGTLPDQWFGYDGVDALILTTTQPEIYRTLSARQRTALIDWVKLGGQVIISAGEWGTALVDANLGELLPGKFARTVKQRETTGLELFSGGVTRLDQPTANVETTQLSMALLSDVRGQVLAYEGTDPLQRPMVVKAPLGFGEVTFVAVDLAAEPVASWKDRGRLIAKLLEVTFAESAGGQKEHTSGEVAHVGYQDLSGQLRAALDQFPGVQLIPFSWVAAIIVFYILLIGPVDYFFLRRFVGRMEFTWLTFALIVVAFSGAAWGLSHWACGTRLRVNQVDLVDIDSSTSLVRGTSWLRLYSPRNQRLDLQLDPTDDTPANTDSFGMLFSWQGLPGDGLGGMNSAVPLDMAVADYAIHDNGPAAGPPRLTLEGLPLNVGATKGFVGRWWSRVEAPIASDLKYSQLKLLRGEFTSPLSVRLTNCLVFHDRWAYRLGNLEPGQTVVLDDLSKPLDVRGLLTDRKIVDAHDITTPWDRANIDDVPRIMQMIMLHEAAGGRGYTSLMHRHEGDVDLSGLVSADRAVVIGRAANPATKLSADGQSLLNEDDQHWTYYRLVLPTQPE